MKRLFQSDDFINKIRSEIAPIAFISVGGFKDTYTFYKREDVIFVIYNINLVIIINSKDDVDNLKKYLKSFLFLDNVEINHCRFIVRIVNQIESMKMEFDTLFDYIKDNYIE